MLTPKEVKFSKIPAYGQLMSLQYFLDGVRDHSFIDYDGNGRLATRTQESNVVIEPSTIHQILYRHPEYLAWATHVMWYNK